MEEVRPEVRTFLIGAVTMSTASWNIAFNLGAFRTIFFDDLLTAWTAISAILIAALLLRREESPIPWWGFILLLLPTIGLGFHYVGSSTESSWIDALTIATGTVAYLVSLPYALYVGVSVVNSDFLQLPDRRLRFAMLAVVAVVVLASYILGVNNNEFLTCGDFKISGNDLPPNCTPGPPLQF